MLIHTIAIDGPAGCGKSTLGRRLSEHTGVFFLDTGLLYRAITRHAMNSGVSIYDPHSVAEYTQTLYLEIQHLRPKFKFTLNRTTVRSLYNYQMDRVVPVLATYPEIRRKVREIQAQVIAEGQVIIAGRDIGTVILPDADLKLYLNVSLEVRAKRQFKAQRKDKRTLEQIKGDLLLRDVLDSTRDISPLQPADDAIIIDTDDMQPEQVLETALSYINLP